MSSVFGPGFAALKLSAALLAFAASAAFATGTSAIVDTGYVVEAIERQAIVWDTRSAAAYKQGHIPGAVNVDDVGAVLREENTEDYIAHEEIEMILGAAASDSSREIIHYGPSAKIRIHFCAAMLQFGAVSSTTSYSSTIHV